MVGVFAPEWVEPLAHVLNALGSEHVWVVHGDGLDELTTAGTTQVAELKNGTVSTFSLTPEDVGLPRVDIADLKGGRSDRQRGRTAARCWTARKTPIATLPASTRRPDSSWRIWRKTWPKASKKAAESIDSGKAKAVAEKTAALSRGDTV